MEQITKEQIQIAADAEAERQRRIARGEADAILARYEAEATGLRQVLEAKAQGYQQLVQAAAGDPRAASTLLMVEKIETMVQAQVEAREAARAEPREQPLEHVWREAVEGRLAHRGCGRRGDACQRACASVTPELDLFLPAKLRERGDGTLTHPGVQ